MAILSLDYRWVAVNDKLCEITGYTSDELMKLTFVDITHPEDVQKDVAQTEALVSGDISCYQMDKRYIKKTKRLSGSSCGVPSLQIVRGSLVIF